MLVTLFPEIFRGLREKQMDDIVVIAGGIIPDEDRTALEEMGVKAIFGPGTSTSEIAGFIRKSVAERDRAAAST